MGVDFTHWPLAARNRSSCGRTLASKPLRSRPSFSGWAQARPACKAITAITRVGKRIDGPRKKEAPCAQNGRTEVCAALVEAHAKELHRAEGAHLVALHV